jgi:4-amino-4-deoxy-L-arabinose transferase-like glycosyltransferase
VAHRRLLILILTLALGVRVGWGLILPTETASLRSLPDQLEYLQLGENLPHSKGLEFTDSRFPEPLVAYRTPGYPWLVALCGANVRLIRVLQALIDTSTVLAVYLLGRRWSSEGIALLASAFVAANPYLVYFSGLILTETLFSAMLAWGMVGLSSSGRSWWSGAVVMALAVLVRPSALVLGPLLAIPANRCVSDSYRWWVRGAARAAIAFGLTCLLLLPWGWRNHSLLGNWVWTTTNSGFTLYDGFNPKATGSSDLSMIATMPELRTMDELRRSDYLAALAWQYISDNPTRAVTLGFRKIARLWSPFPLSNEYGRGMYVVVGVLYALPLFALTLVGMWCGGLSGSAKALLLLPAVYFTLAHSVSVGSLRYRVPADVPMALVAASGATWIAGRGRQKLI